VPDRGWIVAQFAVAAVLLVLSALGVIGSLAFDAVELTFTFEGAIQAFGIFPGLVISLVLNALIMRSHREAGLSTAEKVLLGIEFALVAVLLVCHFWEGPGGELFGLAIMTWPVVILLALASAIVALVRVGRLRAPELSSSAP